MVKINPDPHEERYHFSPLHRVRGVFASCDTLERTIQALRTSGFLEKDIEVFLGEHGVRQLDSKGVHHGAMIRLLREMEGFLADDTEIFRKIDGILQAGGCAVDVLTQGDDEKKTIAAEALKSNNPEEIIYWGHMQVEWL